MRARMSPWLASVTSGLISLPVTSSLGRLFLAEGFLGQPVVHGDLKPLPAGEVAHPHASEHARPEPQPAGQPVPSQVRTIEKVVSGGVTDFRLHCLGPRHEHWVGHLYMRARDAEMAGCACCSDLDDARERR